MGLRGFLGIFAHEAGQELTPLMIALSIVMFIGWAGAYAIIMWRCFKEKTYGIPMFAIACNVTWEAIFSSQILAPEPSLFVWGNRLWLVADLLIVAQLLVYGRRSQTDPILRKWFWPIVLAMFAAVLPGLLFFVHYIGDVYGAITSFLMNLSMSVLFLFMLRDRPDARGLPLSAAWLKMIGTLAGGAVTYLWLPTRYVGGVLVTSSEVHEPPGYGLLVYLVAACLIADALYVALLARRLRSLRTAP
jgi:hypothetical protein